MVDYEKSNKKIKYPVKYKIKSKTKKLYKELRELNQITEYDLQLLSNSILSDFGFGTIQIYFRDKQIKNRGGITKGYIKLSSLGSIVYYIKIYRYTASRGKEITPKVAIDILLHELTHYFDYKIIGLSRSKHTAGFYKRISYLKSLLV